MFLILILFNLINEKKLNQKTDFSEKTDYSESALKTKLEINLND